MARPIRIGIWCDYGVTLTPTEGIGVFVYNLVAGLLELDDEVEVVLLVRPGDQKMAASLAPHASGRLRIVPEIWPIIPRSPRLTRLFQAGIRWVAWARQKSFRLDRRAHWLRNQSLARFSETSAKAGPHFRSNSGVRIRQMRRLANPLIPASLSSGMSFRIGDP
jgi:hypothetical protein